MDRMETVITVSKRSSYFIYSHYLKSFMALFFSMGTNFHHIRCVYNFLQILCLIQAVFYNHNLFHLRILSLYQSLVVY